MSDGLRFSTDCTIESLNWAKRRYWQFSLYRGQLSVPHVQQTDFDVSNQNPDNRSEDRRFLLPEGKERRRHVVAAGRAPQRAQRHVWPLGFALYRDLSTMDHARRRAVGTLMLSGDIRFSWTQPNIWVPRHHHRHRHPFHICPSLSACLTQP